ncbi:glycosyltransferase family 39 protein [Erythrobacter sp.]|uniref:ArnT family glycosyltransferase n=1 Tax=Erythrobacter sp. TaxID=1042 RepID=UPI00311F7819
MKDRLIPAPCPAWSGSNVSISLVAILAVWALGIRLYGIDFGLPAILDPDELIFQLGAVRMIESGNLNPGWFGHPATTTMYVLAVVDALVFAVGRLLGDYASLEQFGEAIFLDPGIVMLPSRIAMAVFAVFSIVLTYRLGTRIGDRMVGLVGAALMTFNPVHIAWSQVVRSDIMATTFLLLVMLASTKLDQNPRKRDYVIASLYTALAITSKWPFALAFLGVVGSIFLGALHRSGRVNDALRPSLWCGAFVCLFVVLISPHLLLDFGTLVSNLQGEAQVQHVGATGTGFLSNLLQYLSGPIWRGLGPLGSALAIAGFVFARHQVRLWVIAGVPAIAILIVIANQNLVWDRWAIALFPFLSILAGFGASGILQTFGAGQRVRLLAKITMALGLVLPPLCASLGAANERIHDNRRQATDWAKQNLPKGRSLLIEHFAFDLVSSEFEILFPIGVGGCFDARQMLAGRIDYQMVDSLRGGKSNLDYAAVPEAKLASCKSDFAILTEHQRYRIDRARFPAAFNRYQEVIASGSVLKRFPAVSGEIGGRPEVLVLDLRSDPDPTVDLK